MGESGNNEGKNISEYQSAVKTLLLLLEHSQLCLANPLRELSKVLDCPTEAAAWRESCRLIKFVLDTKEYGLKIEPRVKEFDKSWTITVLSDSNYAGNNDARISVTGFCIFLLGFCIDGKNKSQKNVTLLLSKMEFCCAIGSS